MTERYHVLAQLEHLQNKYVGTGHPDVTQWEWLTHQHRDTYASAIGHPNLLDYLSIADNETRARTRFNLLRNMVQPCGPPPHKPDE